MATNISGGKHSTISQTQTAAANNKPSVIPQTQQTPVGIQGVDTRTGLTFVRSFATYVALEQWLATDPNAAFYDFTGGRLFNTSSA